MNFLNKILKRKIQYHDDFELIPSFNFRKVIDTGDLNYLVISGKPKQHDFQMLNEAFEKIYNQYLQVFDHGKFHRRIMKLEDKIARMIIKRWTTSDRSLPTRIAIEERRLEDLKKQIAKQDRSTYEHSVAIIQKSMKIPFDPHKIKAAQFYTYVNLHEKEQERLEHESRKNQMKR